MNNKTFLSLFVAAALAGTLSACSSSNDSPSDSTAAGVDPITGLSMDDSIATGGDGTATDGTDATTVVDTSQAGGVAQLSESTYEGIVGEAFAVFTGAAYGAEVLALPPYPGLRELMTDAGVEQGSTSRSDVCQNGGSAELALDWSGARVITYARRGAFDDCQDGSLLIDGEIELLDTDNVAVSSSGLTIVGEGGTRSFSGGVGYGDGNNFGGSGERWWNASELDWSVDNGDAVDFMLTDATTSYRIDGGFGQSMSGSFGLSTADVSVSVATTTDFESNRPDFNQPGYDANDWYYTAGVLRIVAADGSSVQIDAANGDPASARVTLVHEGQSESFDKLWADWDTVLRAGPSPTR